MMVFEDPTRKRWRRVRLLIAGGVLMVVLLAVTLAVCLFVSPALPDVPALSQSAHADVRMIEETLDDDAPVTPAAQVSLPAPGHSATQLAEFFAKKYKAMAFVVREDPNSIADLRRNVDRLDAVCPDWYSFNTGTGEVRTSIDPRLGSIIAGKRTLVFPILANIDPAGRWHGEVLSQLFNNPKATERFTKTVIASMLAHHADGVNLDIEALEVGDKEDYVDWLSNFTRALHQNHLAVTVDVPLGEDAYDYEEIGRIADAVIVMGYDEHFSTGEAGSIAGKDWFDDGISDMAERIPRAKLIVGIGGYSYDWKTGTKQEASAISFVEAMQLARGATEPVKTEEDSVNTTFEYTDKDGADHEVWVLDAVSAWNELLTVRNLNLAGVAVWRLGHEEPDIWDFLSSNTSSTFDKKNLETVSLPPAVALDGDGELLRVRQLGKAGRRKLTFDGNAITSATYDLLPVAYQLERHGHISSRKIALTFDDGPDPAWTPKVLDALKRAGAPGTFFVVGAQAERFPELIRREAAEGHLIGNHTYSHPNIQQITPTRLKMEVNATQRVIESLTGHCALLFRPPYDIDAAPTLAEQLEPIYDLNRDGYTIAGADIDPSDFRRPGADRIAQSILDGLDGTSKIVVLHDAGGDRSQTAQAIELLTAKARAMGYEFVTIDQLLGMPRQALMPPVSRTAEEAVAGGTGLLMFLRHTGWHVLVGIFFVTTGLSLGRMILLAWLAIRGAPKPGEKSSDYAPPLLVLIPAYNEQAVIGRTLRAALASDYPRFRMLVVDDGSTDGTAAAVSAVAAGDSRVGLISKPNGGKHSALNLGFHQAHEEIVVTIDADTLIFPDTLRRLAARFRDPSVSAICGQIHVGNIDRMLTRFQDVEYITSQNFDRRAFDALNCITVVPGATGAWRRSSVLAVGGYSSDTLTEDTDLTLALLRHGGRVVNEPHARSVTEAPDTARALFRQRFRWNYGMLQSLWKHRRGFCRGPVGWLGLPNLLFFQVLFPVLAPVRMAVLLVALLSGQIGAVVLWYGLFIATDLVGSLIALLVDGQDLRKLWVIIAQRFYYQPFLYVVICRALVAAAVGNRHGWNKLSRRASVRLADLSCNSAVWNEPDGSPVTSALAS